MQIQFLLVFQALGSVVLQVGLPVFTYQFPWQVAELLGPAGGSLHSQSVGLAPRFWERITEVMSVNG